MNKGGENREMESLRMKICEHMSSVAEEILCVLDKQQCGADVCSVKLHVSAVLLERLCAAAEFMFNLFQREMEKQNKLMDIDDLDFGDIEDIHQPNTAGL